MSNQSEITFEASIFRNNNVDIFTETTLKDYMFKDYGPYMFVKIDYIYTTDISAFYPVIT